MLKRAETPEAWEAELRAALRLVPGDGTGHLSLYQLTIEEGTAFGDRFAAGKPAAFGPLRNAEDFQPLRDQGPARHQLEQKAEAVRCPVADRKGADPQVAVGEERAGRQFDIIDGQCGTAVGPHDTVQQTLDQSQCRRAGMDGEAVATAP